MRRLLYLQILIILSVAVSCNRTPVSHRLQEVDRLVLSDPDSAITILEKIDTSHCKKGEKAWYTLLQAKGYSKAHKPYPHGERLAEAVKYFRGDNDSLEMQSNFYYGVALRQLNRPVDAIIHLSEAFKSAVKNKDNFYAGLISRYMFFTYQDLYMVDSSAVWAPREKEYFLKTNLPEYINWADATIVESLLNQMKYEECLDSISKIDSDFMKQDRPFRHQILKFKAEALANSGKTEEAVDCYMTLLGDDASLNSKEWCGLGEMLIETGNPEDSQDCLDNGLRLATDITDSILYWKAGSRLCQMQGDLKNALYYSELWGNASVEDNDKDIRNPKIALFSNHLENKILEREQEIHQKRVWLYTLIGISALLTIMILVIIRLYRLKQRAERNEIFYLQEIINGLNTRLEQYDLVNKESLINRQPNLPEPENTDIMQHYLDLVDSVCELYYLRLSNSTITDQIKLTDNIRDFIKSIKEGTLLDQIIDLTNKYDDNWVSKLREKSPSLTDKEIGVLLCEHLKLSKTSTAVLLNYKIKSLYNVRSTAKSKLD